MLKTRVITAIALLAVLLPILYLHHALGFEVVVIALAAAAAWECARLFWPEAGTWHYVAMLAGGLAIYRFGFYEAYPFSMLLIAAAALWLVKFGPLLGVGLPPLKSFANTMLSVFYLFALFACFLAIIVLFNHSSLYLLSAMVIVWVADIGAYFSGKAFGKRKLAPTISPGKSWEGAIGGAIAVFVLAAVSVLAGLQGTFISALQQRWGWVGLMGVLLVLVAFSVIGDLFESQLKRRANVKDSSQLLPGHGGVLDRIDALIPVLPMAAMMSTWL